MGKLDIQQIDFEWMNPLSSYVAITVAVGPRNNAPYSKVMKQLKHFRGESRLCTLLDSLGITYDIMPAFIDCFENGNIMQMSHDDVEEKIECAVDDVRCEAMSAVEELRDDLDEVGALQETRSATDFGFPPEGINPADCDNGQCEEEPTTNFGFAENEYAVGQCKNAVSDASQAKMMSREVGRGAEPKFRPRPLTTNEMDDRMNALDEIIKHPFD